MTIQVGKSLDATASRIITPQALKFVESLSVNFGARAESLLEFRQKYMRRIDGGALPQFQPETEHIRQGAWKVASPPAELEDRRVEITAPADPKMVIGALNSAAKVYMACFEDALSPSWNNLIAGHSAVYDAVRRNYNFTDPLSGKHYELNPKYDCKLMIRPRGLHLKTKHLLQDGVPIVAALVDFGLFFFHNAKQLVANGSGPYLYLPKIEHYGEAAWWDDVISFAERELQLPKGTCKVTVLIETLPAAFEMDEILYHLRDRIVGLNCGRWDYIFSYIKTLRSKAEYILPNREQITMQVDFMRAYSRLLIKTCHKRGAHAIGGMSAYIPVRGDRQANETAFNQVRMDKRREASDGHDGTWVAHPALIAVAMQIFDEAMPASNQKHAIPEVDVTAADLLATTPGTITIDGIDTNIQVSLRYVASWLAGKGAVPIFGLMEDAATAEISRTQLWQWVKHERVRLEDGRRVTVDLFRQRLKIALQKIGAEWRGDPLADRLSEAAELLTTLVIADRLEDFLTVKAFELID